MIHTATRDGQVCDGQVSSRFQVAAEKQKKINSSWVEDILKTWGPKLDLPPRPSPLISKMASC